MGTDTGSIDAFEHTLATSRYEFGFSENTSGCFGFCPDKFDLKTAQLEISGVVPLPAAAWLLGGIAGLGLIAARRKPLT